MKKKIKKIVPYLLILLIITGAGVLGSAGKAEARALTEAEQQQISSLQKTLDSTREEYNKIGNESGGTAETIKARTQKYNDLKTAMDAVAAQISYIQNMASKDLAPETIKINTDTTATGGGAAAARIETYNSCKEAANKLTTGKEEALKLCDDALKTTTEAPSTGSAFQQEIDKGCAGIFTWTLTGCLLKLSYYIILLLPSILLWLSAQFFNAMIYIGINSAMISSSTFIPLAWTVVRDFSNIFFILVLLYVAIQTILGLGHETKKVIVQIVIMALLINFSMFFTKVVIDTSNILALVFYNKLDVDAKNADGTTRFYTPVASTGNDKDVSGAMYKKFNATELVSMENLEKMKTMYALPGKPVSEKLPFGITFGLIVISGVIMAYAAYTFFVAGISFLGRLIELWILIIFSPFAFMSNTIPKLAGVKYLGWTAWLERLIATAFMAPIFMFFMYLIFKLLQVMPVLTSGNGAIATILSILIPALIILTLLKKATKYAEEGGGEFGKGAVKFGKAALATTAVVGGGLAIGGVAALGQSTLGKAASEYANSEAGKKQALEGGFRGLMGKAKMGLATYGKDSTFDARKGAIGAGLGAVERVTGISLGATSKILSKGEGYETDRKKNIAKRVARANDMKVSEDESLTQDLRQKEMAHQSIKEKNAHAVDTKDREIESAKKSEAELSQLARNIDTTDYKKVEDRKNAIDAARKMASATPEEIAAKNLAINNAQAMDVTDDVKVKEKEKATSAAKEASVKVADFVAERSAIKGAGIFTKSDGTTIDYSTNTYDGRLSNNGVDGLIKAEKDAIDAVAANTNPANVAALAAAEKMARAMAEAARAARAVTKAEEARAKAAKHPADATLEAEARKAEAEKTTAQNNARAAVQSVDTLNDAALTAKARTALSNSAHGLGHSQNDYEDKILPEAKHEIHHENVRRMGAYAKSMEEPGPFGTWGIFRGGGPFNYQNMDANATREAVYRIRMGMEAESKKGGKSGGDTNVTIHAPITRSASSAPSGGSKSSGGSSGSGHAPAH